MSFRHDNIAGICVFNKMSNDGPQFRLLIKKRTPFQVLLLPRKAKLEIFALKDLRLKKKNEEFGGAKVQLDLFLMYKPPFPKIKIALLSVHVFLSPPLMMVHIFFLRTLICNLIYLFVVRLKDDVSIFLFSSRSF